MTPHQTTRDRENLLVQLRHWPGPRVAKESLVPPRGEPAPGLAFGYLGDIQLRFVFDLPALDQPVAVRPEDIERLDLTPGRAVAVAAANVKRQGGVPHIASLGGGVYALKGAHVEYSQGYMLDRAFWRGQLEKFPKGLLAALPRRGVLMFAPAGDPAVEGELARQAGRIAVAAGSAAVSHCLFRFDTTGWNVHADLPRPAPVAPAPEARRQDSIEVDATAEDHDGSDLDKAASGQKILIYSILLGFVSNAVARAGVHPVVVLLLTAALAVYSLHGVVRLGSGLGKSTGATIACMALSFVPLANIVTWIVLSVQATRRMRAAGWSVGLLGARA
jgi:hypothetical protein